jgi:hypothetical protein
VLVGEPRFGITPREDLGEMRGGFEELQLVDLVGDRDEFRVRELVAPIGRRGRRFRYRLATVR